MSEPRCYIDGCGKHAVLVLHTYPDITTLCAEHRHLHIVDDYSGGPAEVCPGEGCDICGDGAP